MSGVAKPFGTVAVITRTKNRTLLLRRCIETVLAQSFGQWLHVIVNDGGDPAEVDRLVTEYRPRYGQRLLLLHNPASVGMEAAANIGVRACRSDYVVILDDDDRWDPEFLAKCLAGLRAEQYPGTRGIICHTDIVYERIEGASVRTLRQFSLNKWMVAVELQAELAWNRFPPCSFLFEREVFDRIGYFDEGLPVCGDWDFHVRFLLRYDIAVLPETLAFWHQRPGKDAALGNSVTAGADLHAVVRARMANRWLREALDSGRLTLGDAFVAASAAEYSRIVHDSWIRVTTSPAARVLAGANRMLRRIMRREGR